MYVLVLMMGFNNDMREEEVNGWTERCIEDYKKTGTDLGKTGCADPKSGDGPQRQDNI